MVQLGGSGTGVLYESVGTRPNGFSYSPWNMLLVGGGESDAWPIRTQVLPVALRLWKHSWMPAFITPNAMDGTWQMACLIMIINLITAAVSGKIQTRPRRADRAGYNGNLVLYDPGFDYGAWNHNTTNKGTDLYFQGDGNLLVYQSSITVWKSGTSDPHHGGKDGRKLELTPRGSLYILDQEGKVIWRGR